jgi:Rrf2 family transcriptional regulator, nitric oxide-sensitive transcriptional repressor
MHIKSLSREDDMRLTRYTDYALRVLMYAGARGDQVSTIAEIARTYDISRDHLMKVVQELGRAGYLRNVRGRSGGILLARPPGEIVVGQVVRHTEADFDLVECGSCVIAPVCNLTGVLHEALEAFFAVLDGYTVEDLLKRRGDLLRMFGVGAELAGAPIVEKPI